MNIFLPLFIFLTTFCFSQQSAEGRITKIKNKLSVLTHEVSGLSEQAKSEINVNNITLSNFILAISNTHGLNINTAPELSHIRMSNTNFSGAKVLDLLLFLCKEYQLSIDITGNILSLKKYIAPKVVEKNKPIEIKFNPSINTISIDARHHKLYDVFKEIMDKSAKNLVFRPSIENKVLTSYLKNIPFDAAMDKLALANDLFVEKTKDGFYLFQEQSETSLPLSSEKNREQQKNYTVLDKEQKLLKVNFNKTPLNTIIHHLSEDLQLDIFTATPLHSAGTVTFKAKKISFDDLLLNIFELQSEVISKAQRKSNSANNNYNSNRSAKTEVPKSDTNIYFSYKKEGDIYYFGTENQLSVRKVEVIPLMHRSVELLSDPLETSANKKNLGGYTNHRSNNTSTNTYTSSQIDRSQTPNRQTYTTNPQSFGSASNRNSSNYTSIVDIIPKEISESLEIKVDDELNSLYVTGVSNKIERLKKFISSIDQTIPVVLIEVMFVEVNKSVAVETGANLSISSEALNTGGKLFPQTDFNFGANAINKVLNGFEGFNGLNLGKMIPNFFATVKAMEANGNLNIKSTPKLSTLNGHRATFSNGETSYYTVTQRNIYGTDNPQTSEITNYEPINAELGITIKPLVSGDGQVTLEIFVVQSNFGIRIDDNAPPDISSKAFSSIIRVQNQDIVVLGGLEEQVKNETHSGVPFLARIPLVKWFFSSRKSENSTTKLTVFIKPTIVY